MHFRLMHVHVLQWVAYLLLLLYWHPFPTVLLPCLCSTQQQSLVTWCNVSSFKLVTLPAFLHRSAKHGDMRCLSYETQH